MARVELSAEVRTKSGAAISGASVQVNMRNGGAATVFAAATGGTTLSNPLTTVAGAITGWVEEGSYDLVITFRGVSTTERFEASAGVGVEARERFWRPTGAIETFSRANLPSNISPLLSGRLYLAGGVVIPSGTPANNISFCTQGTAAGTPTNQWFCLVDQSLNVLRKTVDDTTTAWPTNTIKTLALSSTYTPTTDMPVYLGIVVVATTVPTLLGVTSPTFIASARTPVLFGASTTGLTDPASLGATAAALNAVGQGAWAYVT